MKQIDDWPIAVRIVEDDPETRAELVLGATRWFLDYSGRARRNPADEDAPEIGETLAVGRALVELGNQLITIAEREIAAREAER
jgi:hypothetical protein